MAGTIEGGKKAAAKNKQQFGDDFYKRIGRMGGQASTQGGFALMDSERVRELGRKGGKAKRKPKDSQYEQIKQRAAERRKRKWLLF